MWQKLKNFVAPDEWMVTHCQTERRGCCHLGFMKSDFLKKSKYRWLTVLFYFQACSITIQLYVSVCMLSCFICVRLFVTPWTVARQAPLSVGILQAKILEWVAMPFSRGSSQPRDWTLFSHIAGGFSAIWVIHTCKHMGFPGCSDGKESTRSAEVLSFLDSFPI